MARNLKPNHFDTAGFYVEGKRSGFRFRKPHHASFMSGMWVPLGDPIPVFPGVKLDLNINAVIRSNTMVCPPLDPMFIDFMAVFVPHRIIWNNFPQFFGENDTTAWTQSVELVYPYISTYSPNLSGFADFASDDIARGNVFLWEHYGLAGAFIESADVKISVMATRGYYAIWNYLCRDENYQRPVLFSKGDTGSSGEFGYLLIDYKCGSSSTVLTEINTMDESSLEVGDGLSWEQAVLMPANKLHDAFTSVLPQPQFGDAVTLGLGDTAEVKLVSTLKSGLTGNEQIIVAQNKTVLTSMAGLTTDSIGGLASDDGSEPVWMNPNGSLYADLSQATAVTINQLRSSIMTQRYLEALARSGRRIPEFYSAIYGVQNTAAAHDYPELLTQSRYVLGVNQVVATADASGSGWTSRLGDTGAYSLTTLRGIPCCEKDFTEFGYVHILYAVRAENIYSQMIQPHFLKQTALDEYNPFFDHIGDVSIPNYVVNTSAGASGNFGYQEAWWDERTQLGLAVGALNKKYGSLKYWVIGETFGSSLTTCTPSFLCFDPATLDDIFVSNYNVYPQFIGDFLIYGKKVARMSQHSIPGIVGRI